MTRGFFITGTDTGVGKTRVAQHLIGNLVKRGLRVAGMKPVATGCVASPQGLRNDDALALLRASNVDVPYETCNPYAFEPPIAPHIAAQRAGKRIDLGHIVANYEDIAAHSDAVIVEGVGGWLVPLNETAAVADLAGRLRLPVILVVGLRLGCLNHAALTCRAIVSSAVPFAGWIANHIDTEFRNGEETEATLRTLISAPCLGALRWDPEFAVDPAESGIDMARLTLL